MNIKTEVYDQVSELAFELVGASSVDDTKLIWTLYNEIKSLCEQYETGDFDHPFQWETLADFTTDDASSIEIYEKAFGLARNMDLGEYMGSIKLALAERYSELGLNVQAYDAVTEADTYAKNTDNMELRTEVSQFLLCQSNNT